MPLNACNEGCLGAGDDEADIVLDGKLDEGREVFAGDGDVLDLFKTRCGSTVSYLLVSSIPQVSDESCEV